MKNHIKIVSVLLSLIMIVSVLPLSVSAAQTKAHDSADVAKIEFFAIRDLVVNKDLPKKGIAAEITFTDGESFVYDFGRSAADYLSDDNDIQTHNNMSEAFYMAYDIAFSKNDIANTVGELDVTIELFEQNVRFPYNNKVTLNVVENPDASDQIKPGETVNVRIENKGDIACLTFVPERDMRIIFSSNTYLDTRGRINAEYYDEESGEYSYVDVYDDDGGNGLNFKVRCSVKAGVSYTLKAYLWEGTGSFDVTLEENTSIWDYEEVYDDYYNSISITGYYGTDRDIEIPATIDQCRVTAIGSQAFSGQPITSVVIPDSVNTISSYAFENCTALTDITIPDSVTSISYDSLCDTAWYDNQPDGVVYAGKAAIHYKGTCPAEVTIAEGTKSIGQRAFQSIPELAKITLPDSVTIINSFAFSNCTGLTQLTLPDNLETIEACAFKDCTHLSSASFPAGLNNIYENAFLGCTQLSSVTFAEKAHTSIRHAAFGDCPNLKEVTLLPGIRIPDNYVFGFLDFKDNDYPDSRVEGFTIYGYEDSNAEYYADDNGFKFVTLEPSYIAELKPGDTVKVNIENEGDVAYLKFVPEKDMRIIYRSMTDLDPRGEIKARIDGEKIKQNDDDGGEQMNFEIRCSVKAGVPYTLSASLWYGTGSFDVTIEENTSDWDYMRDYDSDYRSVILTGYYGSQKDVEIPATIDERRVTKIGSDTFRGQSVTSVVIPHGVTGIGSNAFADCSSLTDITFPDSIDSVEVDAFRNSAWFDNQPDGMVYVGSVAHKYKGVCPASVSIKDGTRHIGEGAFADCTGLETVSLPEGVTTIEASAFKGCAGLCDITLPESLRFIYNNAFRGCSSLTSMTFSPYLWDIYYNAFGDCPNLKKVTVFNKYGYVSERAFGYTDSDGKVNDLVIYGYDNSSADYYAMNNGFTFVSLDKNATPDEFGFAAGNYYLTGTINGVDYGTDNITDDLRFLPSSDSSFRLDNVSLKEGDKIAVIRYIGYDSFGTVINEQEIENTADYDFTLSVTPTNRLLAYSFKNDDGSVTTGQFSSIHTGGPVLMGDADGNGELESVDAAYIQRLCALMKVGGLDNNTFTCSDIDKNDCVDVIDATIIQRHLAGIPVPFEIGGEV